MKVLVPYRRTRTPLLVNPKRKLGLVGANKSSVQFKA